MTPPTLIAKTFAVGCATTETRFFSQDRVMPNERRQHARLSGGGGEDIKSKLSHPRSGREGHLGIGFP
jgi:hypothetical protein